MAGGWVIARVLAGVWVASTLPFAADSESGSLLSTDAPPGAWTTYVPYVPGTTLAASASAAHRGAFGLRAEDTNAQASSPSGQAWVEGALPSSMGSDIYVRSWVRVGSSNGLGSVDFAWLANPQSGEPATTLAVGLIASNGALFVGSNDEAGNLVDVTQAQLTTGRWYLLEAAATGIGAASGMRRVWLDGVQIHQRARAWTQTRWRPNRLILGEPWSQAPTFAGELHYDDVRVDWAPLASRWKLVFLPDRIPVDGCAAVRLELVDSVSGAPAPAPYPVTATLSSTGLSAALFDDDQCSRALAAEGALLPQGQTGREVWLRAAEEGEGALSAADVDFLPATASFTAARLDSQSVRELTIGCNCQASAEAGAFPWLALAISGLALRLRRRFRR